MEGIGGDWGLSGLAVLPCLAMGFCALAVLVPAAIWVIRLLNQTWLDPEWGKRGRAEPEQAYLPDERRSQNSEAIRTDSHQRITSWPSTWNTGSAGGDSGSSAG